MTLRPQHLSQNKIKGRFGAPFVKRPRIFERPNSLSHSDVEIVDLRQAPEFLALVANRIWQTWWEADGYTLADVVTALEDVIKAVDHPFTLVAVRQRQFLGTVTSIMDDIGARPDWGPCLAALWVEPEARGEGLGEALMDAVSQRLSARGFERVYLSAKPKMRAYYLLRGWTMIDSDIDKDHQDVFMRLLTPCHDGAAER